MFSKGRELYGLYEARAAFRDRGYALVTEGYMDVVALAQLGFPNAVATLGTACTPEHVQKLFRFTESVVFSFDGDAAGRRAARKALDGALPYATDVRSIKFLFLPAEHDPDSFIREHGAEAFARFVNEATPLSRFLLEAAREGCDLTTAEGRAHMASNAAPALERPARRCAQAPVAQRDRDAGAARRAGAVGTLGSARRRRARPAAHPAPQRRPTPAGDGGGWRRRTTHPDMPPPQDLATAALWKRSKPKFQPRKFVKGERWGGSSPARPSSLGADAAAPPSRAGCGGAAAAVEHGANGKRCRTSCTACCATCPASTAQLFTWLDSQLHEHGVQPWAALREGMRGLDFEPLAERLMTVSEAGPVARGRGGAAPGRRRPANSRSVLDFMLDDLLKAQQSEAIAAVGNDPKALERYKALETRRLELRARLRASGSETA